MTTITANSREGALRRAATRGVTLVELVVGMSISAVVMAAIFGSFNFLARSSLLTVSYAEMDLQARVGLETLARDVRMASDIQNVTANGMTLVVPNLASPVRYDFVPAKQSFYRNYGQPGEKRLISGIDQFVLKLYSINRDALGQPLETTNLSEVKQLQIQLREVRAGAARATVTNNVISARYVLRNKDAHD